MLNKYVKVTLSSEQHKTMTLTYEVRDHDVGQIWIDCLKKSIPGGFRERKRFYNFPNRNEQNLNNLTDRLLKNILALKIIHPEFNFPELDFNNLSVSINHLHQNFAHTHLVEFLINEGNNELWNEFNNLIHAIESNLFSARSQNNSKFPHSKIVFTWNDQNKIKIPEPLFNQYDIGVNFGYAYFNYDRSWYSNW